MDLNSKITENLLIQTPKTRWGIIIPFLIFALAILFVPIPFSTPKPVDRFIRIDASSYQFTPGELKINPGDRVTIELVSTDVVHGISIDGYDFTLTSDPGQTATGTFVADKAGMFRFRCSIACGNLHPFMIGKLQVGSNLLMIRGILSGFMVIIAAGFSIKQSGSQKQFISVGLT